MSQVVTRKSAISDEKEKRTDSPVKDMKKKVAANAEKEKQAAEKTDKQPEKIEKLKQAEKPAEKNDKLKQPEKPAEKNENPKQPEKPAEKNEKPKQAEKPAEKNEKQKQPEKATEKHKPTDKAEKSSDKKVEKNGVDNKTDSKEKKETQEKKDDKADKNSKAEAKKNIDKPKQNGSKHNGVESNGVEEAASDDDVLEIADDEFPELAYDDNSDNESPTPDCAASRSATRRSQVKVTRTPETPQPASDKQAESANEQPKDKVLKLSEAPPSDRKLRSDDPKTEKKQDKEKKENGEDKDEIIDLDADDEPRKTDTNYSKSRVKVSPYRRSSRLADNTASSVMANYTGIHSGEDASNSDEEDASIGAHEDAKTQERLKIAQVILTPMAKVPPYLSAWLANQSAASNLANYSGNNTTMEMDITETSSFVEEGSLDDSSYLNGLRSIRGRRSYKPLKELSLKHVNRSVRSTTNISVSEARPTGTVVGRKRKPDSDDAIEVGTEAAELSSAVHGKRMRLLDRIAQPFRRTLASTPMPNRRNTEIVGINTDLPLSAPVSAPPFDPESLKAAPPTPPTDASDADRKRCVVM